MGRSPYVIEYSGVFDFPCPPDQVWSAMRRVDRFECWWGWLKEFHVEGAAWRPVLSFTSGGATAALPSRRPHRAGRVHPSGCIVPPSTVIWRFHRLVLEPGLGAPGRKISSNIELVQPPLRVAARIAPWALRWGHDRVVEATVSSFRVHVLDD
jgi:hypothetical protein